MDIAVYPRLNTSQLVSHPGGTASQRELLQVGAGQLVAYSHAGHNSCCHNCCLAQSTCA